jgi:hypothetical protein
MVKLMLRRGMLAALAAAFVTAGVAYATSTSGGIDACAKTTNGQLRLDTGDGCLPRARGSRTASGRTSAGTRP